MPKPINIDINTETAQSQDKPRLVDGTVNQQELRNDIAPYEVSKRAYRQAELARLGQEESSRQFPWMNEKQIKERKLREFRNFLSLRLQGKLNQQQLDKLQEQINEFLESHGSALEISTESAKEFLQDLQRSLEGNPQSADLIVGMVSGYLDFDEGLLSDLYDQDKEVLVQEREKQSTERVLEISGRVGYLRAEISRLDLACHGEYNYINVKEAKQELLKLEEERKELFSQLSNSASYSVIVQRTESLENRARLEVALKIHYELEYRFHMDQHLMRHGVEIGNPEYYHRRFEEEYGDYLRADSSTRALFEQASIAAEDAAKNSNAKVSKSLELIISEMSQREEDLDDLKNATEGLNAFEKSLLIKRIENNYDMTLPELMYDEMFEYRAKQAIAIFELGEIHFDYSVNSKSLDNITGSIESLKDLNKIFSLSEQGLNEALFLNALNSPAILGNLLILQEQLGLEEFSRIQATKGNEISSALEKCSAEEKSLIAKLFEADPDNPLKVEEVAQFAAIKILSLETERAAFNVKPFNLAEGLTNDTLNTKIEETQSVYNSYFKIEELEQLRSETYAKAYFTATLENVQVMAEKQAFYKGLAWKEEGDLSEKVNDLATNLEHYKETQFARLKELGFSDEQLNQLEAIKEQSAGVGTQLAKSLKDKIADIGSGIDQDVLFQCLEGINQEVEGSTLSVDDKIIGLRMSFEERYNKGFDCAVNEEFWDTAKGRAQLCRAQRLCDGDLIGAYAAELHLLDIHRFIDDADARDIFEKISAMGKVEEFSVRFMETGKHLNEMCAERQREGGSRVREIYKCKTLDDFIDGNMSGRDAIHARMVLGLVPSLDALSPDDQIRMQFLQKIDSSDGFLWWNDKTQILKDLREHIQTAHAKQGQDSPITTEFIALEIAKIDRLTQVRNEGETFSDWVYDLLGGGDAKKACEALLEEKDLVKFDRYSLKYAVEEKERDFVLDLGELHGTDYFYQLASEAWKKKDHDEIKGYLRSKLGSDSRGGDRFNVLEVALESKDFFIEAETTKDRGQQAQLLQQAQNYKDAVFLWRSMAGVGTEEESKIADTIHDASYYGTLDDLVGIFNTRFDGTDLKSWVIEELADTNQKIPQTNPDEIRSFNRQHFEVQLAFRLAEQAKYNAVAQRADLMAKGAGLRVKYYSEITDPAEWGNHLLRWGVGGVDYIYGTNYSESLDAFLPPTSKSIMIESAEKMQTLYANGAELSEIQGAYLQSRADAVNFAENAEERIDKLAEYAAMGLALATTPFTAGASLYVMALWAAGAALVARVGTKSIFLGNTYLGSSVLEDVGYSALDGVSTLAGGAATMQLAKASGVLVKYGLKLERVGAVANFGRNGARAGGLRLAEEALKGTDNFAAALIREVGEESAQKCLKNATYKQLINAAKSASPEFAANLEKEFFESALYAASTNLRHRLIIDTGMQVFEGMVAAPIMTSVDFFNPAMYRNGFVNGLRENFNRVKETFVGGMQFALGFSLAAGLWGKLKRPNRMGKALDPKVVDKLENSTNIWGRKKITDEGVSYLRQQKEVKGFLTKGDLEVARRVNSKTTAKRLRALEDKFDYVVRGKDAEVAKRREKDFDENNTKRRKVSDETDGNVRKLREDVENLRKKKGDEDIVSKQRRKSRRLRRMPPDPKFEIPESESNLSNTNSDLERLKILKLTVLKSDYEPSDKHELLSQCNTAGFVEYSRDTDFETGEELQIVKLFNNEHELVRTIRIVITSKEQEQPVKVANDIFELYDENDWQDAA